MSDYGLRTNDDFSGPVSDLIKIVKACEKAGIDVKNVINVLKRPDKKEVLKQINEYSFRITETQKRKLEEEAQKQRASDFGIGE